MRKFLVVLAIVLVAYSASDSVYTLGASPEETWVCAIIKAFGGSCD